MQIVTGGGLRIAILNDYQGVALGMADWPSLGAAEIRPFDREFANEDAAVAALSGFEVLCLMRERMVLTRSLIERLPKLRLVVVTGGRFRCVDLAAAAAHGVTVCASGGGDNAGAAELAMGLVLACARRIPQEDRSLRAGGWQEGIGMLLEGKTLGVLGLGRFGSRMARYGAAFGMRVVAWSPNLTAERAAASGVDYLPRERFFAAADVISVHLVLGETTRGIVGPAELALMKRSAILVNTSRGPLIDEAALVEALASGRIGAAGLDVFDNEPMRGDHPLKRLGNTVLTPHVGFVTDASYTGYFEGTVAAIRAWRAGTPINVRTA